MPQLEFFTRSQLASWRDRTASRNYSAERDEFRREHERHRKWGLRQRHGRRLMHVRIHGDIAPPADRTSTCPAAEPAAPTSKPTGTERPPVQTSSVPRGWQFACAHDGQGRKVHPADEAAPAVTTAPAKQAAASDQAPPSDHTAPSDQGPPSDQRLPRDQANPLITPTGLNGTTRPIRTSVSTGQITQCQVRPARSIRSAQPDMTSVQTARRLGSGWLRRSGRSRRSDQAGPAGQPCRLAQSKPARADRPGRHRHPGSTEPPSPPPQHRATPAAPGHPQHRATPAAPGHRASGAPPSPRATEQFRATGPPAAATAEWIVSHAATIAACTARRLRTTRQ